MRDEDGLQTGQCRFVDHYALEGGKYPQLSRVRARFIASRLKVGQILVVKISRQGMDVGVARTHR